MYGYQRSGTPCKGAASVCAPNANPRNMLIIRMGLISGRSR